MPGLPLAEGGLKLVLNIYRSWVSENAVRQLRNLISGFTGNAQASKNKTHSEGVEVSMVLTEVRAGRRLRRTGVSEPLLQGGILATVFRLHGLFSTRCWRSSPWPCSRRSSVFVPLMQRGNQPARASRIQTLREVSGGIINGADDKEADKSQGNRIGMSLR